MEPTVGNRFEYEGSTYVVNRVTKERGGRLVIDCMSWEELQRRYANLGQLLHRGDEH